MSDINNNFYLFTTENCPRCLALKRMISQKNLDSFINIVDVGKNPDLIKIFQLKAVPTMLVVDKILTEEELNKLSDDTELSIQKFYGNQINLLLNDIKPLEIKEQNNNDTNSECKSCNV